MSSKYILLMYISENSGHHMASKAIENALRVISPSVRTLNINGFAYTNPIFEKFINRTYMSVIRNKPEVWEYLYDNPKVLRSVQGLRDAIHKSNSKKLKVLLDDFKPAAVVCTQAFPCGMIADYKKIFNLNIPLFGVLTDHAPHSYWLFEDVNYYVVPSEASKNHFIRNGVSESKIRVFGIPIDPKFKRAGDKEDICRKMGLDPAVPIVLIMGGSQGLGPVAHTMDILERISIPFQVIVVCGVNRQLEKALSSKNRHHKKKIFVFGLVENIDELMEISSVIVTKPGGLTTAEALSKRLPMIIMHPIPGQESKNTEYLLKEGVALKAEDSDDIAALIQELFSNNNKLEEMRKRADEIRKPNSAVDVADLILKNC